MGLTSWFYSFYSSPATAAAPTRSTREECWNRRDTFFACLDKEGISVPNGPEHVARKGKAACVGENKAYEGSCAQSWVSVRAVFAPRRRAGGGSGGRVRA